MNRTLLIASLIFNFALLCFVFREKIEAKLIKKYGVVFFGDSITASGNWRWMLKRIDVKNSGNPGFTTSHLLWLVNSQVIRYQPKVCYIQGGLNDIGVGMSLQRTKENYTQILDTLIKNNVIPIVQSTLFTVSDDEMNQSVDSINVFLKQICRERKIKFIDLNSELSSQNKLLAKFSTDGKHLNQQAYHRWLIKIKKEGDL